MLITDDLARRLEEAEAIDAVRCAEAMRHVDPECGAAVDGIGGGMVVFCGPASPLTHALAIGMHGPVTEQNIDAIEFFFISRGADVSIDVCPHADPSLRELLVARGYRLVEMSNVVFRPLQAGETWPVGMPVSETPDEEEFARTVTCGFFGRDLITDDEFRVGRTLFHMPGATPLIAHIDGQPAGACCMSVRNCVASFYGDATLASMRGRGVHAAMIAARLNMAVAARCYLATAGTQPGSTSQRNYQRLGFQVAYTKCTFVLCAL